MDNTIHQLRRTLMRKLITVFQFIFALACFANAVTYRAFIQVHPPDKYDIYVSGDKICTTPISGDTTIVIKKSTSIPKPVIEVRKGHHRGRIKLNYEGILRDTLCVHSVKVWLGYERKYHIVFLLDSSYTMPISQDDPNASLLRAKEVNALSSDDSSVSDPALTGSVAPVNSPDIKHTVNADIVPDAPSSGSALFYPGLGLTIAGGPLTIFGILGVNDLLLQNIKADSGGIISVNGIPVDTLEETTGFSQYSRGIGVACFITTVIFEAVGIPLLVKGMKKKKVYNNWLEENHVSFHINSTGTSTRFTVCLRF